MGNKGIGKFEHLSWGNYYGGIFGHMFPWGN